MADFIYPRALADATPVWFRPERRDAAPSSPSRLVASWAFDADGRLVMRWRQIAAPSAACPLSQ
jgi:hypothetical protein